MIKKFFSIAKFPISIVVGGYAYFWLISNPQESYPIPIILYWIPDVIGWKMALIIIIAIMYLWYFLAVWNGISKKLVVV